MEDCLVIGGGVIGLSIAYELARDGASVRVVDQGQPGRAASWAGAGMLPPGSDLPSAPPIERLAALSMKLFARWTDELRDATGIDNGYRNCGAIYLAHDAESADELALQMNQWSAAGIACTRLDESDRVKIEPALLPPGADSNKSIAASYVVSRESQVRNPRHLKALAAACRKHGVQIESGVPIHDFQVRDGQIVSALTSSGRLEAGSFCLTAGAWSAALGARLGMRIPVKPIRGQIVLLATADLAMRRIVNDGPRYLVPRDDGLMLIGSTEEDVGFDCRTTAQGVNSLLEFGIALVPKLAGAEVLRTWAGLRPASVDGLPYLGRISELGNGFVATGHFRHGLRLSPAPALVMAQIIRGEQPELDVSPFRPEREVLANNG